MGTLEGKSAVIAGAGQGIGQAVARLFAREGASVALLDINEEGLADTDALVAGEGGPAVVSRCDVTNRADVDAAVDAAIGAHGKVDILVNTPMIMHLALLQDQTEEALMGSLRVMVLGVFNTMQACFPSMRKSAGGRVINFGSGAATNGAPGFSTYAAAKEAVRGLSNTAANEWGRYAITVNSIIPWAQTPSFWTALEADSSVTLEDMAASSPLGRAGGDPLTDIAPLVAFLAGEGGNFITGRTLFADGGQAGFR
jgi:NAD(P)-dependent dehydrogenase (short-subunit alcohol dehydrogenase family)